MRTYWVTLVSASIVLVVVGLVIGGLLGTATDGGSDCGSAFSRTTDPLTDSPLYGPECTGPRRQARQLPVALLLLGGSGLVGASIGGFVVRRRAMADEAADDPTVSEP